MMPIMLPLPKVLQFLSELQEEHQRAAALDELPFRHYLLLSRPQSGIQDQELGQCPVTEA